MSERESAQAEHDRKKAEREADHAERRARLGHEVPSGSGPEDPAAETEPGPTGPASDADDKPKPKRGHKKAESEESEE